MFFCDFLELRRFFRWVTTVFSGWRPGVARVRGKGLAIRHSGDVLLGGASGAGSLLLNTKASQEAACSRAPAAIVPCPAPELRDAGVSLFSENGSHLAEVGATEGRARQVEGPGSSRNVGTGSHLEATDAAEGKTVHALRIPSASVMTGGPAGPSTQSAHDRPALPDPVGYVRLP